MSAINSPRDTGRGQNARTTPTSECLFFSVAFTPQDAILDPVVFCMLAAGISHVRPETRTVKFINDVPICTFGTPTLMRGDTILSAGPDPFTIDGPLIRVITFLQTGRCGGFGGLPGNGYGIFEATLVNPSTAGFNSPADITFLGPFALNVALGFK
ncbi:hypothetical protein DFH09DRAFT_1321188 [Mycena vulgaris]|nr:hypothetical protein DFH09DRAFT_1321188 [Mycena vulgaris]